MDILLEVNNTPRFWVLALAIVPPVVVFGAPLALLAGEAQGKVSSLILGTASFIIILVVPLGAIFALFSLPLPDSLEVTHVEADEESLREQAKAIYGYELLGEADRSDVREFARDEENGLGVYDFETENGSEFACAVQDRNRETEDDFPVDGAPLTMESKLFCSFGEPQLKDV